MLRKSVFSCITLVVFMCFSPGNAAVLGFVGAAPVSNAHEIDIFNLVNDERSRMRLGQLEWDDRLAAVARDYSRQMAREGFFEHADRNGNTITERAASAGIKNWRKLGENLFVCEGIRDFTNFAVEEWMNSETHRRNILDRKWTATGVGMARDRNGRIYVTEVFLEN